MKKNVPRALLLAACVVLTSAAAAAQAEKEAPQEQANERNEQRESRPEQAGGAQSPDRQDAKVISGMSILGNQEAPKSLVIVPWKSSEIGDSLDISTVLDDSRQPVDKEVFLRELRYYEIRSGRKP
ncbi:MAG: hypothetical protein JW748_00045 [Anaerolineales bacterium]|nr:hypothetical protein [Anaerolineales bacterium]